MFYSVLKRNKRNKYTHSHTHTHTPTHMHINTKTHTFTYNQHIEKNDTKLLTVQYFTFRKCKVTVIETKVPICCVTVTQIKPFLTHCGLKERDPWSILQQLRLIVCFCSFSFLFFFFSELLILVSFVLSLLLVCLFLLRTLIYSSVCVD